MAKLNTSPSNLKKIGKIIADRASQEDAAILPLSGRHRPVDQKAMAKLLEKHIDGIASLKPEFEALMARNEAKAEARIEKLRVQAVKIGRSRKPAIDRMIAQQIQAAEILTHPAIPTASYWVNTPIEIYSTGFELDSLSKEPNNSWAKFLLNFDNGKELGLSLVFRFVWENSTDKYVVIDASTFMVLHGFCDLSSGGGFFPSGERHATLGAWLWLELIDYTTEPFLSFGRGEQVEAFSMEARSEDWFADADSETQLVAGGHIVKKSIVPVPPRTAVGLHAIAYMNVDTGEDTGKVRGDFISHGFGMVVPGVVITVLS